MESTVYSTKYAVTSLTRVLRVKLSLTLINKKKGGAVKTEVQRQPEAAVADYANI